MSSLTMEQVKALYEVSETLEAQLKVFLSEETPSFVMEFNKKFASRLSELTGISYENAVLVSTSIECDIYEEVDTQEAKEVVERISSVMVDALLSVYDYSFDRKTILANYNVDILKNIAGQMYLKL